jgi:hypothetical protein
LFTQLTCAPAFTLNAVGMNMKFFTWICAGSAACAPVHSSAVAAMLQAAVHGNFDLLPIMFIPWL